MFTLLDVTLAIRSLNSNRAPDLNNMAAEHLKGAPPDVLDTLLLAFNTIAHTSEIPIEMKSGYKLSIPKKGKSTLLCTNHRGITITSIFGKVLEHLILGRTKTKFGDHQSDLQFGFSEGMSPVMASLCLTEAIAEAHESRRGLVVACLDAQKAFDVVDHNCLRLKLDSIGIKGKLWLLIDNLHLDINEVVKWKGHFSDGYTVKQGVRQGGILSTYLYKVC